MVSLLVLLLSLPSIALAKNAPPKDFRFGVRTMPNFSDFGYALYIFYLGRLSGRDDGPDWSTLIANRVPDTRGENTFHLGFGRVREILCP